jgi:hypothetical protein
MSHTISEAGSDNSEARSDNKQELAVVTTSLLSPPPNANKNSSLSSSQPTSSPTDVKQPLTSIFKDKEMTIEDFLHAAPVDNYIHEYMARHGLSSSQYTEAKQRFIDEHTLFHVQILKVAEKQLPKNPMQWTPVQVGMWVASLGAPCVMIARELVRLGVNGRVLMKLNSAVLGTLQVGNTTVINMVVADHIQQLALQIVQPPVAAPPVVVPPVAAPPVKEGEE